MHFDPAPGHRIHHTAGPRPSRDPRSHTKTPANAHGSAAVCTSTAELQELGGLAFFGDGKTLRSFRRRTLRIDPLVQKWLQWEQQKSGA
jgi:hypothetical protein